MKKEASDEFDYNDNSTRAAYASKQVDSKPNRPKSITAFGRTSSFKSFTTSNRSNGTSLESSLRGTSNSTLVPTIEALENESLTTQQRNKRATRSRNKKTYINQGSTRIKNFSKKVSKLNPVQSLLRTNRSGKYAEKDEEELDSYIDDDSGTSGGVDVKSHGDMPRRTDGIRASPERENGSSSDFMPVSGASQFTSDTGSTHVNSIQARKGSVLDQVRINLNGTTSGSYDDGMVSDSEQVKPKEGSVETDSLSNDDRKSQLEKDLLDNLPLLRPTVSVTYPISENGGRDIQTQKNEDDKSVAAKTEGDGHSVHSYQQSIGSNGALSTGNPSDLQTAQLLQLHRSNNTRSRPRKKSVAMDEHIKKMLSKWYFEDTVNKSGEDDSQAQNLTNAVQIEAITKNENEIKALKLQTHKMEEVRSY